MRSLAMLASAIALTCALSSCVTYDVDGSHIMTAGQLTKIDGRALTLTTALNGEHRDHVVYCNWATLCSRVGIPEGVLGVFSFGLKGLKIGQVIYAVYPPGPGELTRLTVAADRGVSGNLTKIEGMALTITSTINGKATDTVVHCNDATDYRSGIGWLGRGEMMFEDLKTGQVVLAGYNTPDNGAVMVIIESEHL